MTDFPFAIRDSNCVKSKFSMCLVSFLMSHLNTERKKDEKQKEKLGTVLGEIVETDGLVHPVSSETIRR